MFIKTYFCSFRTDYDNTLITTVIADIWEHSVFTIAKSETQACR